MRLSKKKAEWWAEEVKKCKQDFVYFAEKYCFIVLPRKPGDTRTSNLLKIILYEYQKSVITDFEMYQWIIFNKSRQMGVSVIVGLYLLWKALFSRNEVIIVISENRNKAQEFILKIKIAYEKLPDQIKGHLMGDNKGELEFQSGSRIISRASTVNAARGDTPSILVIDEAAFISTHRMRRRGKAGSADLAADLFYAAEPALNLGGKCIIISTPNGMGNFFERTFTRAKMKQNQFHAIELNWWQRPEYTPGLRKKPGCGYPEDYTSDWLENKIKNSDDFNVQILQETFAQFLGSGKTVLSYDYLKTLTSKEPKNTALGGALRIFQDPDPKFKYVMGVDTAEGDGSDFNSVQVFNSYTKEQVAEYFSKVDNIEFVKHVVNISNLYFNPLINAEADGIGFSTINGLKMKGVSLYKSGKKFGTKMAGNTRDLIVSLYKDMPQLNLKLNSDLLINQMHTFVWMNGRADHETGCHDDLIFSMMLAVLIIDRNKTMDIGKFMFKDEKNLVTKTRIEMEDLDKYMAKQNDKAKMEHKYAKALNFGLDMKYIDEYEMLFGKPEVK